MSESLIYKIAVTRIRGIGSALAKNLIAYIGSAEGVFFESEKSLEKIPGIGKVLSKEVVKNREGALMEARKESDFMEKNSIFTYYYADNNYPFRLKECVDAPVILYGKGNLEINNGKFIAIVGTRNATETGKEICRNFVDDISKMLSDVTIVSGLAYGIDIYAHKAAVDSNLATIGVLGHGLDRIYPSAHHSISQKMQNKGGLLSEFVSGTNPDKSNFVQRNRIIAGLCDAVVVVESKSTGGALITANIANDYNRDVFAFPGRIYDECSKGCNELIKSNRAQLIESADDLLCLMNWQKKNMKDKEMRQMTLFNELSDEEQEIYTILNTCSDGIHVNELSVRLSKPFSKISSLLLEMEFKNIVKCLPGNIYVALK